MRSFGEMIEWKMLSNGLKNNDIKKIFQLLIYTGKESEWFNNLSGKLKKKLLKMEK